MYVMLRSMIILWSQVLSHKGLSREWNFGTHLGMRVCEIRNTLWCTSQGVSVLYFNMGVCIVQYGTEWYTLSWWWECVHMRVCTPHYVQQYSVVWLWVSSNCS